MMEAFELVFAEAERSLVAWTALNLPALRASLDDQALAIASEIENREIFQLESTRINC